MGVFVDTRTFRSGNSVAVRLPRELGFSPDVPVRLEKVGNTVHVTPLVDEGEEKRRLVRMLADLDAVGPVGEIEARDADIFPDRPGLY
jgi:antitoxin VapB